MKNYSPSFIFKKLTKKQKEVLKFLSVGLLCLSFNTLILDILINKLQIQYLIATTIGFFLSNLLGFFLNKYYTFKAFQTNIWRELYKYYAVMGSSFLVNLGSMFFLVTLIKINPIISSLIIAVSLTSYNYIMHTKWSFKIKNQKKQ